MSTNMCDVRPHRYLQPTAQVPKPCKSEIAIFKSSDTESHLQTAGSTTRQAHCLIPPLPTPFVEMCILSFFKQNVDICNG